ncbi:hypothetical protein PR048_015277 [Dryococelus australis]|uniref:Uncharacterized protein n=1 Tax=Dryococelus australis TaxID=614101 RepID=A0ABQ9HGR5_9NEOP|nr:hypothetical protein PR048_015277 [Dryococelus australis]
MHSRGVISDKTRRPAASSGMILTCENRGVTPPVSLTMPLVGGFTQGSYVSPSSALNTLMLRAPKSHHTFPLRSRLANSRYCNGPVSCCDVGEARQALLLGPVAPSWFETRSEIVSKIDTENCCTIRVQSWTGDRNWKMRLILNIDLSKIDESEIQNHEIPFGSTLLDWAKDKTGFWFESRIIRSQIGGDVVATGPYSSTNRLCKLTVARLFINTRNATVPSRMCAAASIFVHRRMPKRKCEFSDSSETVFQEFFQGRMRHEIVGSHFPVADRRSSKCNVNGENHRNHSKFLVYCNLTQLQRRYKGNTARRADEAICRRVGVALIAPRRYWFDSRRETPHSFVCDSCYTMSLLGEFSRGSPVSPALAFQRCFILTSTTKKWKLYITVFTDFIREQIFYESDVFLLIYFNRFAKLQLGLTSSQPEQNKAGCTIVWCVALGCDEIHLLAVSQLSDDLSVTGADTDNRNARISLSTRICFILIGYRRNLLHPDWLLLIATQSTIVEPA